MKCYNLIFNINIFKNNFGNYITISFFLGNFLCLIFYIRKGISSLKNNIKNIILDSHKEINNKNNIFIYKNKNNNNNLFHKKGSEKFINKNKNFQIQKRKKIQKD